MIPIHDPREKESISSSIRITRHKIWHFGSIMPTTINVCVIWYLLLLLHSCRSVPSDCLIINKRTIPLEIPHYSLTIYAASPFSSISRNVNKLFLRIVLVVSVFRNNCKLTMCLKVGRPWGQFQGWSICDMCCWMMVFICNLFRQVPIITALLLQFWGIIICITFFSKRY